MGILKIILTLFVLTILSSCTTQKKCSRKFPNVARVDSIYIEKLKVIPVEVPGDSIIIEVPIDCPDQDVTVETAKLKQTISILNKKLSSKTTIKPDTVKIYVPEIREKIVQVKVPEIIKEIPRFWKFTGWTGIASILILIVLFGLKIAKYLK